MLPIDPQPETERPSGKEERGFFNPLGVVIGIVISLLLVPVMVPGYMKARDQGNFSQCQSNCKNIGTALEIYCTDNDGHYPRSITTIIGPQYLTAVPTCASARKDTYSWTYDVYNDWKDAKNDRYTFCCGGKNHWKVGIPENFPRYSSEIGLEQRP